MRSAAAAVPHMKPVASIINTPSINSDMPKPTLLAYAATRGAIVNFTAGLAQLLADRGIRANSIAPGPIWNRAGQPAEVAPAYVFLASDEASYVSGARIAVTGGKPII